MAGDQDRSGILRMLFKSGLGHAALKTLPQISCRIHHKLYTPLVSRLTRVVAAEMLGLRSVTEPEEEEM